MQVDICSIMFNEEILLPMWIESWLSVPFVNKIYLVDGQSTDRSVEIAKSYRNRVNVMVVPWTNDFSRARNIVLKMSKPNVRWVVQPDLDELPCGNLDIDFSFSNMINEYIIPYIKFYDWDRLWFFKNNVPCLMGDKIRYAINKSTTTIFSKDHLKGYEKSLHEMPILAQERKLNICSIHKKEIVSFDELKNDFFIGHVDQAKHFEQARRNNTSVELEMGLKRVRYRMISDAAYSGKVYNKQWAEEALSRYYSGDDKMIEELGMEQLKSFMSEHDILRDYNAFILLNKIVREKLDDSNQ